MAKTPDAPKVEKLAPPAEDIDAESAGEAMKKFMKGRKGAASTWLTKGQTLGGGMNLKQGS